MRLRRALRHRLLGLIARYRPLYPADGVGRVAGLTLADVEAACDWDRLQREGSAPLATNPLAVAGLRFSRIFPHQLLWTRPDGKVVVVDVAHAVTLIHDALEQRDLQSRLPSWAEH